MDSIVDVWIASQCMLRRAYEGSGEGEVIIMLKVVSKETRPFLSIPECAEEFGFPVATIRNLIKQDAFPVMKVGRVTYVMRDVFKRFVESGGVADKKTAEITKTAETAETAEITVAGKEVVG